MQTGIKQHTLSKSFTVSGVGLHSGQNVVLRVLPADQNTGIVFVRTDIRDRDNTIAARWDNVVETQLCTVIGNADNVTVGTIEHLMAALRGCEIDNARVELDGAEVPILDGSSEIFVEHIETVGIIAQDAPRRFIKILKNVAVEKDGKSVTLKPSETPRFTGRIDFPHKDIGRQDRTIELMNGNFKHDLADSRTFGFLEEVEALKAIGLARGGSLENAIVLDKENVLNPEGLRHGDEFIRHKLLDAIGDLYLCGAPIIGEYIGVKAGHALNNAILHVLFADETAWTVVEQKTHAGKTLTPA